MNKWISKIISLTGIDTSLLSPESFDPNVIRSKYGLELPSDYLEFISTFGKGSFYLPDGGPILEVNDFNDRNNLESVELHFPNETNKEVYEEDEEVLHGLYPEIPGRFPWGRADTGHSFYWLIGGSAEPWPIVAINELDYYVFETTMCEFLFDTFSGGQRFNCWTEGTTVQNPKNIEFHPRKRVPLA
jgi:hypothetical protein